MLKYLFENSSFGELSPFLTPNFFSVLSLGEGARIASLLLANRRDVESWSLASKAVEAWSRKKIRISGQTDDFYSGHLGEAEGSSILEIFFLQVLGAEKWILDFRASTWGRGKNGRLAWRPKPYFFSPSPSFRKGVSDLYIGFYRDDKARFNGALKNLGLLSAEKELRHHFGLEGQNRVRFRLADFQRTFASVFSACEREGLKIDAEFAVLGLLLLTLYNSLETIGESLNVRAAFERAMARRETL